MEQYIRFDTIFYIYHNYYVLNNEFRALSNASFSPRLLFWLRLVAILLVMTLPNVIAAAVGEKRAITLMLMVQGLSFMLLPALFRMNLRRLLLLWLPVVTLVPAAAAFVITTGYQPSEWALLLIMEANQDEFSEFAVGVIAALVIAPILFFGLRWMICRWVPPEMRLQKLEIFGVAAVALSLTAVELAQVGLSHGWIPTRDRLAKTFPFSIGIGTWRFWQVRSALVNRSTLDHRFEAKAPALPEGQRQIHLVMLGETCRYANFSRHGYHRQTSPKLDARADLLDFTDVVSSASYTSLSVPMILTATDPTNYKDAPKSPSFLNVFRKAGYKVYWLTTQKKTGLCDTSCSLYAQDADESRFLSGLLDASSTGGYAATLDSELITAVQDVLSRKEPKILIICHSMGSHAKYTHRYPEEFNRFHADPALCVYRKDRDHQPNFTEDNKTHLQNAYDNSILFTDHVIDSLINTLAGEKQSVTSFCFVPDHGENDGTALMLPFAHGVNTVDVLHVPMFMWLSPEYRRNFPLKSALLTERQTTPFSSNHLFHTIIDLAGIASSQLSPAHSLCHPDYKTGPRLVVNENGAGHKDYDKTILETLTRRGGWKPLFSKPLETANR